MCNVTNLTEILKLQKGSDSSPVLTTTQKVVHPVAVLNVFVCRLDSETGSQERHGGRDDYLCNRSTALRLVRTIPKTNQDPVLYAKSLKHVTACSISSSVLSHAKL